MHILNIVSAIKNITVNEIRDLIFENYYKRVGLSKENNYYSMTHQKKRIYICLQLNHQKKYLILVLLRDIIIRI